MELCQWDAGTLLFAMHCSDCASVHLVSYIASVPAPPRGTRSSVDSAESACLNASYALTPKFARNSVKFDKWIAKCFGTFCALSGSLLCGGSLLQFVQAVRCNSLALKCPHSTRLGKQTGRESIDLSRSSSLRKCSKTKEMISGVF